MNKVIARLRGGLGNQLFCYAAARRLAHSNQAELVIDDHTGFVRDLIYSREYALKYFSLPSRVASSSERLEPFERSRRAVWKIVNSFRAYENRSYIVEECRDFDYRLLELDLKGSIILDGLWQDERYFKDIAEIIRSDLAFSLEPCSRNESLAGEIKTTNSVAMHIRWYEIPGSEKNMALSYYNAAISELSSRVENPHFYIFSDDPVMSKAFIPLDQSSFTLVDINSEPDNAIMDFWLMTQCSHFIIANSTFSWWAAWLSIKAGKNLLMPSGMPRITGASVWSEKSGWD